MTNKGMYPTHAQLGVEVLESKSYEKVKRV